MRTVTVYYSGHQYPSHTGSGVKSYHLQMRTVKDVNTSVKLSLSRAECLSTEHAYIALPQRLSICERKLLFHLTFFMSAELSAEQLLFSFYRCRKFYCLLDPTSTNTAPTQSLEKSRGICNWDTKRGHESSLAPRYLLYYTTVKRWARLCPRPLCARLGSRVSVSHRAICAISFSDSEGLRHFLQDERVSFRT